LVGLLAGGLFLSLAAKRHPCSHKTEQEAENENYPASLPLNALHRPSTEKSIT
jgi:hypothetical protein